MTENTSIRWVAGLSNGETLVEGRGICEPDQNASSWAKLQGHLLSNGLKITSFSLQFGDQHFNLPSISPKFGGSSPHYYNCFRRVSMDTLGTGDGKEEYICAEAIYDDFKLQVWVDLYDHNKSWTNIIPI